MDVSNRPAFRGLEVGSCNPKLGFRASARKTPYKSNPMCSSDEQPDTLCSLTSCVTEIAAFMSRRTDEWHLRADKFRSDIVTRIYSCCALETVFGALNS